MVAAPPPPDNQPETPHELLDAFTQRARNPEVVAAATMLVADVELSVSEACRLAAGKSSPETVRSGLRRFLKELKPLRAGEDEWVAKLLKKGRLRTVEDPRVRLGRAGLDVVTPTTIRELGGVERDALFERLAADTLYAADIEGRPLDPSSWVVGSIVTRVGEHVVLREASRTEQKGRKRAVRRQIAVLEALVLGGLGWARVADRTGETPRRVRTTLRRVVEEAAPIADLYPLDGKVTVPLDRLEGMRRAAEASGDHLDVKYEATLDGERALVRVRVRAHPFIQ